MTMSSPITQDEIEEFLVEGDVKEGRVAFESGAGPVGESWTPAPSFRLEREGAGVIIHVASVSADRTLLVASGRRCMCSGGNAVSTGRFFIKVLGRDR